MNYEEKYKEVFKRAEAIIRFYKNQNRDDETSIKDLELIFPELKESEDEKVRKEIIAVFKGEISYTSEEDAQKYIAWLEKQGEQKPNYCHHEVDLSNCSEEYRKAYYDGWNNCNMQHSQCESEKSDVLKCLINGMKFYYEDNEEATWGTEKFSMKVKDILDWLEKQGEKDILEDAILDGNEDGLIAETIRYKKEKQAEQNQTDKVKPKFKVGDWIINPRTGLIKHIKNVLLCDNNGNYEFESSSMSIDSVDNSFHLWTIQDAKDGDVLAGSYGTFILMGKSNGGYCGVLNDNTFIRSTGNNEWTENLHPATKEQRDLLFQKMKEAGYEWDAENKAMTKIEQKPTNSYCQENCKGYQETGKCFADGECKAKREAEQELQLKEGKYYECIKSYHYLGGGQYWFEKGSVYFCEKDGYLRLDSNNNIYVYDCKNWQNYFRPYAEKLAWSEEDEQRLNSCLNILQPKTFVGNTETINTKWLKSLKDRVQPQPKQEWSEEEIEKAAQEWELKANFNPFYMTMDGDKPTGVKQDITTHKESFKAGVNWTLKSLRPQNNITDEELTQAKKNAYNDALDKIEYHSGEPTFDDGWSAAIDYIRKKSIRPQNRWKPSDEQMEALDWQVENTSVSSWQYKATKELMEDLKKLKEE